MEKHAKAARLFSCSAYVWQESTAAASPAGQCVPTIDYEEAAARLDKKFHSSLSHYDRDKVQLPPLLPGEAVFIQCEKPKKWEKTGRVLGKGPDVLSYLIDIEDRLIVRSQGCHSRSRGVSFIDYASLASLI